MATARIEIAAARLPNGTATFTFDRARRGYEITRVRTPGPGTPGSTNTEFTDDLGKAQLLFAQQANTLMTSLKYSDVSRQLAGARN